MAYQPFETENANYHLVYSRHSKENNEDIFSKDKISDLDGIVLERGSLTPSETLNLNDPQYSEILKNVMGCTNPPKIYLTDVDSSGRGLLYSISLLAMSFFAIKKMLKSNNKEETKNSQSKRLSRRSFLKTGAKATAIAAVSIPIVQIVYGSTVGLAISSGSDETSSLENALLKGNSTLQYICPNPIDEFRNVVTAKKTEEFIAPKLQKELGRKPNIAVVFGAAHSGLKEDLQNKTRRDLMLNLMIKLGYPGLKKEFLNNVIEAEVENGEFRQIPYELNLFPKV